MNDYIILTDSSCDLPDDVAKEMNIEVLPLTVHLDGKTYNNYLDWRELSADDFYDALRQGKMATTSAVNVDDFLNAFEDYTSQGKDVLYIGFSTKLSSTFNSAVAALGFMEEESMGENRIILVDSLSGCLGQGLLVYLAAVARAEGKSIDEVRDYIETIKVRACHWICVSDLHFFARGGRLSKTGAIVGTILGIKPLLRVNSKSILEVQEKVRGRKKSMEALVDKLKYADDIENQVIFLAHTGCEDEAKKLEEMVRAHFNPKGIIMGNVGPVVGSHAGPDAVALFFLGERDMP